MDTECLKRLASCKKVLVGLGEEWKNLPEDEAKEAYASLYRLLKDKDYFIITMATDAAIYDTELGSQAETVVSADEVLSEPLSCSENSRAKAAMDRIFPEKERKKIPAGSGL